MQRTVTTNDGTPGESDAVREVEDLISKLKQPEQLANKPTRFQPADIKKGSTAGNDPVALREPLAKLTEFAESSEPLLRLAGLNAAQRFRVHSKAHELGLSSVSDAQKVVIVTRISSGSSSADENRPVPASQSPPASAPKQAPSTAAAEDVSEQQAKVHADTVPVAPRSTTSIGSVKTTSQLKAEIEAVSGQLNSALMELRSLRGQSGVGGVALKNQQTMASETVLDIEADLESGFVPQVGQPLSAQELVLDSLNEAVEQISVVRPRTAHVAIASVIGTVSTELSTSRDEGNNATVTTFQLDVNHPVIEDRAAAKVSFEVRSYSAVLSRFCERNIYKGDLVHVLGHILPDCTHSRSLIVLTDHGSDVNVIVGKDLRKDAGTSQ